MFSFSKWNSEKAGYCQTSQFHSVQIFVWNWKVHGFFWKFFLRWSCSFAYKEKPPLLLPSASSRLSGLKYIMKKSVVTFILFWNIQAQHPTSTNQTIWIHQDEHLCFQASLFSSFPPLLMLLVDVLSPLATSVKPQLLYYL